MYFEKKVIWQNSMASLLGVVLLVLALIFLRHVDFFIFYLIIPLLVAIMPWLIAFFDKMQKDSEMEKRFPDFIQNIVSAIEAGMSFPKAIMHAAGSDYGALTPHTKKLKAQVSIGTPIYKAFSSFANGISSGVIKRAVSTIVEAERAGGNVQGVLEEVTQSVYKIEEMKQKMQAGIKSQIIQVYVIFVVFLILIVVIFQIVMPSISSLQLEETGALNNLDMLTKEVPIEFSGFQVFIQSVFSYMSSIRGIFLAVGVLQGFFAGIVLGKMAGGSFKSGIKNSLIMMVLAAIILLSF